MYSFFDASAYHRVLHSFPTRRSSDLASSAHPTPLSRCAGGAGCPPIVSSELGCQSIHASDRKSTRLNSSHVEISYAVFCLKKKNALFGLSIIYIILLVRSPHRLVHVP